MSIGMALLALLDQKPAHGFALKTALDARTAHRWPVNVGQVYTTLARLERDELVRSERRSNAPHQPLYSITRAGRARLAGWFGDAGPHPQRDETILKIVLAFARGEDDARRAIDTERRAVVERRDALRAMPAGDVPSRLFLEALRHNDDARLRWLDACDASIGRRAVANVAPPPAAVPPSADESARAARADEGRPRRRLLRRRRND